MDHRFLFAGSHLIVPGIRHPRPPHALRRVDHPTAWQIALAEVSPEKSLHRVDPPGISAAQKNLYAGAGMNAAVVSLVTVFGDARLVQQSVSVRFLGSET